MKDLDWDDLRFFLAVAAAGSLSAAARELNVNTTTVLRRIGNLEAALEARLFELIHSRVKIQLYLWIYQDPVQHLKHKHFYFLF